MMLIDPLWLMMTDLADDLPSGSSGSKMHLQQLCNSLKPANETKVIGGLLVVNDAYWRLMTVDDG